MDTVQLSYKRAMYFKGLFDEMISLSFFTETDEVGSDERRRIVLLGKIIDSEIATLEHVFKFEDGMVKSNTLGIIPWYKKEFPTVWHFRRNEKIEDAKEELNQEQLIVYNHLTSIYLSMQWWASDEDEPSDKFLDDYAKFWNAVSKDYAQYCEMIKKS
jgi:hypothetical protein